jgi:hypothetical protein
MERRTFVQASIASACALAAGESHAAEVVFKPAELYEWRIYTLKPEKQPLLDAYLSKAFIPVVTRALSGPVGVFVEESKGNTMRVHVLIVHPTGESAATLATRIAKDETYQNAAKEFLDAKAADPVYTRIESSLLSAIEGLPKIDAPDASKPRLFELRIYESHNERANLKKIEMFNTGELSIFKRVGLTPVLFGQAILGNAMPNLTYLLVFPDKDGRKAAWDKFRVDPEWVKLKSIPEYADKEIVSKITNLILTPTKYSQV